MKKSLWILVGITAAFACVLLGFFLGRNTGHNYIPTNNSKSPVTSEKSDNTQDTPNSDGKININTADKRQLMLLDGIGETTAQKIIDYRTENGNYKTIEDLMNVNGIGQKKFEQIKDKIKAE